MRNILFVFLLVPAILLADYSLVSIKNPSSDVLRMGELLKVTPDGEYIFIFNKYEMDKLKKWNVGYRVLIPDMEAYYSARMKGKGSQGDYYSYAEADSILHYIHTQYPDLVTDTFSLGKSWENHDIYCVKLTNTNSTYPKKQVLIDAMIHAREPIGANLTVEFVRYMVEHYNTNAEIKYLLDHREVYVIPVLNPDGYLYNEANYPNGGGMWRKNRRDNGDGSYGVDLNRNYEYMWGYDNSGSSPYTSDETYRGPSPASEPETQVSESLGVANNFVHYLNIHSYSNLIIVPWGYVNEWPAGYDSVIYEQMSIRMRRTNGYTYGTSQQTVSYPVNGPATDWYWGDRGAYAFVIEVGEDFWQEEQIPAQLDEAMPILYYLTQAAGPLLSVSSNTMDEISGDGDPYVDPGEEWKIHLFMENIGSVDTLTSGQVVLTTDDPWITIGEPIHNVPNLAPFTQHEDSFSISVMNGAPAGHIVLIYAKCYTEGDDSGIDTISFAIGNPPVDTIFFDDFESGTGKWVWEGTWDLTTSSYHSPTNSATDSPGGNYNNNTSYGIETNVRIDLTNASNPKLIFYHKYEIEEDYDYGRVIIKHGTETDVLQSYTGDNTTWTSDTFDLSSYIGDTITVRFQLDTDVYVTYDGWYIDDVLISEYIPSNLPPERPSPISPVGGANTGNRPVLVLSNTTDPENDPLTYGFVVYSDSLCTNIVVQKDSVPEGTDSTYWQVENPLPPGTYYWRGYAYDGHDRGLLSDAGSFVVTTGINETTEMVMIDNVLGIVKPLNSTATGFDVQLRDQIGRVIYTGKLGTGLYMKKLNLPSGMYFVSIKGAGFRKDIKILNLL